MTPEDKIVAAIDRNTEATKGVKGELGNIGIMLGLIWLGICVVGCPRAFDVAVEVGLCPCSRPVATLANGHSICVVPYRKNPKLFILIGGSESAQFITCKSRERMERIANISRLSFTAGDHSACQYPGNLPEKCQGAGGAA